MNRFAGNIVFEGSFELPDNFPFDFIEAESFCGDKFIYIFGEIEIPSSDDLFDYFNSNFGKVKIFDLSISSEDKLDIMPYDFENGIYEVVSFEGADVNFDEILNRFSENDTIFSVRECEVSSKFGNRVIRADFVY